MVNSTMMPMRGMGRFLVLLIGDTMRGGCSAWQTRFS
jgi:hypothetical protein